MSEISLRMIDGTHIVLPASLDAITTYVILEQEKWFEKETTFLARWLKPGMKVIDVGANLGVYSLPMARLVGPDGHVFSYEPASETQRLLKISKKKNRANNLHVIGAALSDGEREGHLVLGASSELNTLDGSGPGESVQITSLDAEDKVRNWGNIDFLKIDAEGEEERILTGAKAFFAHQSPLVMFEVKAGDKPNENLRAAFMNVLRVGRDEKIPNAAPRYHVPCTEQHLGFISLNIGVQDIEALDLSCPEKLVHFKFACSDESIDELSLESIALEVGLSGLQKLGFGFDKNDSGFWSGQLEPHRIMPPIGAKFDH